MAITAASLQAQLGANTYGTAPIVVGEYSPYTPAGGGGSSNQYWHVLGGVAYPGKSMIIKCTASDSAATQATTVTNALTGAGNANV